MRNSLLVLLLLGLAAWTACAPGQISPEAGSGSGGEEAAPATPTAVNALSTVEPAASEPTPTPLARATPAGAINAPDSATEMMSGATPPPGTEALVAEAARLLVEAGEIGAVGGEASLVAVESREWRDSSLGCPQEGFMYTQVITPGYVIVVEANGRQYEFHTDTTSAIVFCPEEE